MSHNQPKEEKNENPMQSKRRKTEIESSEGDALQVNGKNIDETDSNNDLIFQLTKWKGN